MNYWECELQQAEREIERLRAELGKIPSAENAAVARNEGLMDGMQHAIRALIRHSQNENSAIEILRRELERVKKIMA